MRSRVKYYEIYNQKKKKKKEKKKNRYVILY